jgi:hypothetical protein
VCSFQKGRSSAILIWNVSYLLSLLVNPENGCNIFLRNVGTLPPDYMVLHPRKEYMLNMSRIPGITIRMYIFFSMVLPAHSGPWPLIQFRNHFSQTVGLLGRMISPSQCRYLNTRQHKQNKRIHTPNIHALSGVRTHDSSVRASEDSSCLRPRGHCNRQCTYRPIY